MTPRMMSRAGVTMLELIVVVAIMGIMAGVVGLAVARTEPAAKPHTIEAAHAAVADARRTAIRRGSTVAITVSVDAQGPQYSTGSPPAIPLHATAFPDGSVIADSAIGIDRLTGRPQRARRAGGHE